MKHFSASIWGSNNVQKVATQEKKFKEERVWTLTRSMHYQWGTHLSYPIEEEKEKIACLVLGVQGCLYQLDGQHSAPSRGERKADL